MSKQQGKFGKIIAYVLIVFILIGAIGFLAYNTDGFTGEVTTFSVECDGRQVMKSASGFTMSKDEPMIVKVKYAFEENNKGYSIKVVPNSLEGKDFDFKVDGQVYSYQAVNDLTSGFVVEYKEDSFSIKTKGSLTDILQAVYSNKQIEDCTMYSYENMFTLIVYSYDEKSSVRLNFSVPEKVTGIKLDKEAIIF